jgi:hypothetical protein
MARCDNEDVVKALADHKQGRYEMAKAKAQKNGKPKTDFAKKHASEGVTRAEKAGHKLIGVIFCHEMAWPVALKEPLTQTQLHELMSSWGEVMEARRGGFDRDEKYRRWGKNTRLKKKFGVISVDDTTVMTKGTFIVGAKPKTPEPQAFYHAAEARGMRALRQAPETPPAKKATNGNGKKAAKKADGNGKKVTPATKEQQTRGKGKKAAATK